MRHYKYLIVGGGMAADSALEGIREVDSEGTAGLISAETHPPYNRPPLSKGLWKGEGLDSIWRGTGDRGVEMHLGRRVVALDPERRQLVDDTGQEYGFERLLLATGASPRRLPFGGDEVIHFRTLDDYERLRRIAGDGQRIAVTGGGFIGSEVAAALAMNGAEVVMAFPEEALAARILPRDLGLFVNDYYRQRGVELRSGEVVAGVKPDGDLTLVETRRLDQVGGQQILVDGVVAGLGVSPNLELARMAGLAIDNGIVVDESLRSSKPNIFAAGDVASFYSPSLEKRLRVEHEDNAVTMGLMAGRSMAGEAVAYHHLPFFYSDLFDLGYEAVGELDVRMDTVIDWKELYREGVIYYLRDGRVRGVLLWNVWEQVEAARQLIAQPGPFRPEDLAGRLG